MDALDCKHQYQLIFPSIDCVQQSGTQVSGIIFFLYHI